MNVLLYLVFWAVVGGLIGLAIGNGKGRGAEGFWLGLFLGFIGWIIVAAMRPSEENEAQRAATIAAAVAAVGSGKAVGAADARPCPWCAEPIKVAARVCRYCGRDVEPLVGQLAEEGDLERVRGEYPGVYAECRSVLEALPQAPVHRTAWLSELCKRVDAGSPPDAAAARIPLDWTGSEALKPQAKPSLPPAGDPTAAGEFPDVEADFPRSYDRARAVMVALETAPAHPGAWLRELCTRIEAGSPPTAAAERIPPEWQ